MSMDKKQKGLLVITFIAVGFLTYQIIELFVGDNSRVSPPMQTVASTVPSSPIIKSENSSKSNGGMPIKSVADYSDKGFLKEQRQYLQIVNQYELARMKRQLLEEQAAIANAQHQIALMNKKTRELSGSADNNSSNTLSVDPENMQPYVLSYLDQQKGHFNATLRQGNYYQEVSVGSILPDGYQVTAINRRGVIVQKDRSRHMITFNGIVAVTEAQQTLAQKKSVPRSQVAITKNKNDLNPLIQHQVVSIGAVKNVDVKSIMTAQNQVLKQFSLKETKNSIPIKARGAFESADDFDDDADKIPKELHLRTVSINPEVPDALRPANFISPPAPVPQSYHLVSDTTSLTEEAPIRNGAVETADEASQGLFSDDEGKLLDIPSHLFVIQLLSSADSNVIGAFARDNQLRNKSWQFSINNEGKVWYILLYGRYATFTEAEDALMRLPEQLKQDNPWVRSVADVQHIIREEHKARV